MYLLRWGTSFTTTTLLITVGQISAIVAGMQMVAYGSFVVDAAGEKESTCKSNLTASAKSLGGSLKPPLILKCVLELMILKR